MEDVSSVYDQIDVPRQDVGNNRFETALEVDQALVPPGIGGGFAVRRVAKVGISQMGDAERSYRKIGACHCSVSAFASMPFAWRQGSDRELSGPLPYMELSCRTRSPSGSRPRPIAAVRTSCFRGARSPIRSTSVRQRPSASLPRATA